MANNNKENKIEKFTKEAIGKTLNQFNKEIGIADLVEINKNQDRILNGILSQVNDENTEKTEKSNIITLDNSTDGIVELKEIQGDTNVNVSKIEEMPITHDIGDKEGNVFTLNEIPKGAISIGEIQGNTMVNCNKDDKKELVLMKDLSTQGDNNITLTEGVDGGLVDVALEGNTLVNVSKTKDSTALPLDEELIYLYTNTQYTVQFVSDKAITIDIALGGTQLLAQSIVYGINRISITTPSELVNNKLIIDGAGANISEVVVTDTNREFGYFEGMKSVGECEELEIMSNNKNLWNTENVKRQDGRKLSYTKNNNIITYSEIGNYGIFIPIKAKKNETLRISGTIVNVQNIRIFNSDVFTGMGIYSKDYRGIETEISDYICTFPNDGEYYIRVWCKGTGTAILTNFLAEISSTNTTYVEHQSNTQTLTHEPLRAVGDAKDRYVLLNNKWYIERNCGYNNILRRYAINTNTVKGVAVDFINRKKNSNVICDSIKLGNPSTPGTFYLNPGNIVVVFDKNNPIADEDMIAKVSQYNFITQLETPVYESIDYNPFEVYSDVTHITTNSAIPTNVVVKNHGFNCLLKPSTTYTISSNLGLNTVTTPSTLTEDCLRFMDTDTSDVTTMRDVLVLEGDWTTKTDLIPGNFNGIESCFEQELVTDKNDEHYGKYKVDIKVVGKNKFDGQWQINEGVYGVYYYGKGTYTISIQEKDLSLLDNSYSLGHANLDGSNVNWLYSDGTIWRHSRTLTNGKLVFRMPTKEGLELLKRAFDIQIEPGVTATSYEPYKENNITFYINEPLRGVGDAKDRVFIQGDKVLVERNVGTKRLIGEYVNDYKEPNNTNSNTKPNVMIIQLSITNLKPLWGGESTLCNKLKTGKIGKLDQTAIEHVYWGTEYNWIACNNKDFPYVGITVDKTLLSSNDIEGARQYINNENIELVYELAEPVYEEVEYSSNRLILNTFNNESFNNSTLFLDTNISPKLSFKPLWEELVYVKSNTKYYIQFNAVGSGEVVINLGGTELTTEIVEEYNCIPITTPSESTNLMTIIGQGITISEVVVSEVVCGGYYKGLQSCFEEHMENGKYRVLLRGIALDGSKVNGIKLYINEPLRGIEDVKDRLCIKNGKLMVERKCGSITLDGSPDENWVHSADGTKTQRCSIRLPLTAINGKYLCDRYEVVDHSAYDKELLFVNADNVYLKVPLDNYSISNVKKYLQQNPVTVVYQLAEPTYEEATNEYGLPIVFEGYENGIVYIDSAVTPTTHIKYTSNNQLATTLAEAEEQNITTQEDINMNVITYMMDIDMMLTDMEMSNDISVMAVRRDSSNENMLDRMSEEDKKVYRDNTVVMLEKMITANVLEKEDIEGRIDMYYNKNRISKEQYKYLKSLL